MSRSFALREPIFYQLHQNNVWSWRPGTIINKLGAANYLVLVDGRHIKAHANQLKHRFDREFDIYGSPSNDQCISQTPNVLDEAPPQCAIAPTDILSDVDPASDDDPLWAEDNEPADRDEEIPLPEVHRPLSAPLKTRPQRNTRLPAHLNDFDLSS